MKPADCRALVAVDLGAESCRVSLLQWTGGMPRACLVHRFENGPVSVDGCLRWPWQAIEGGVHKGLRRAAGLAPEGIRALAVDGWAVDYARLRPGSPAPFCYRDARTLAVERQVDGTELRRLTGVQTQRINTAYQLLADRLAGLPQGPWLNLPEFLLHRLGARPVAEFTNASHTQLLEAGRMRWCREAFALLQLDMAHAPPLVAPGSIVGRLQGPLTSLAAYRDTVLVAGACHDTASAIAGIAAAPGPWAYISAGTWSLVGTLLNSPETGAWARAANYTNLAAAGGKTLFHKGLSGMWLVRQCIEHWETQSGTKVDLTGLIERASALPPPGRLLDVDDPELLLAGDMPGRIARQAGLAAAAEPAVYTGLIFHSLAARYASILGEIAGIIGREFERLYVVGGASRNAFLNRLIERSTGLTVTRGPVEASTHGNFAVQLAALEDGAADAGSIARWSHRLTEALGVDGIAAHEGV